uniref:Disease resistance protein n=1 Tax=Capsicum baccatum TaxID=33114 RepID=A0A8K0Y949_CAPBA|nr:disease resistance protein [Capsicum baccatum]
MAHASVASLTRTIASLLTSNSPMRSLSCDHREELRALHEKVSSLEVFIKNFEKNNVSGEMTDFEEKVKQVANIVEQTIQLSVTEVVLANDKNLREKAHERLSDRLQQVAEDTDRIWKESTKIQDKGKHASKELTVQEFPSSTKNILNVENSMVGRDDQRKRLVEDLTRSYSGEPKVIPIVGMGGIGKTTLANEVYNVACIRSHFDVCAWATISQQNNVKEILLSVLRSTKDITFDIDDEADLANMLQKSLKGKRYLIVLDDMWKSEAWDAVRLCFPSENKGSRILLTTRNTEVARDAGTENLSLQMDIMGPDESWNRFKSVAFANEALSYEFETIGKKIAQKCHRLPLTIAVVAGLLKFKRAIDDWENVAKDVKTFVTNDPDERCSRVLGLSYNHLTSDLKTCLLHLGIFPEDSEIPVKNLMRSWMAEGFLKLENDLEGRAEKCLQELVDRCLVLVCKKSLDGTKIRSCKVHDLIYDLCMREIQRENIFITKNIVQIMQPFLPLYIVR